LSRLRQTLTKLISLSHQYQLIFNHKTPEQAHHDSFKDNPSFISQQPKRRTR